MEFEEEGEALTLDNVSVEGTTTSGGWRVATQWEPARVRVEPIMIIMPCMVVLAVIFMLYSC